MMEFYISVILQLINNTTYSSYDKLNKNHVFFLYNIYLTNQQNRFQTILN